MSKLFIVLSLLCASCAHVKPCVSVAPPSMSQMECQTVDVAKGYLGLICVEESVQKFATYLEESQKWQKETWESCKEKVKK